VKDKVSISYSPPPAGFEGTENHRFLKPVEPGLPLFFAHHLNDPLEVHCKYSHRSDLMMTQHHL